MAGYQNYIFRITALLQFLQFMTTDYTVYCTIVTTTVWLKAETRHK